MLEKTFKTSKNRQILEILLKITQNVASFQRENFQTDVKTQEKTGFRDLVTEIDIKSQQKLEAGILQQLLKLGFKSEEIGFFGEEGNKRKIKKYTFIIDPIDGTLNFATGFPYFSISIGVLINNEFQIGLVYESLKNQAFVAIKNQGSFKLDLDKKTYKPLKIKHKPLSQSLISGNFGILKNLPDKILNQVLGVRILFGFALEACLVAENLTQANFSKCAKVWDIAATLVIVKEAGGEILSLPEKEPLKFDFQQPEKAYPCLVCHVNTSQLLVFG